MKALQQISTAALLGYNAFKEGEPCVPHFDKELAKIMKGRKIGETPEEEAPTIKILQTWIDNWNLANINN